MKRFSFIISSLFFMLSSLVNAYVQPPIKVDEEAMFKIHTSLGVDTHFTREADKKIRFGLRTLGGSIGFMHNVGNDIEYGLGISMEASAGDRARLFSKSAIDSKSQAFLLGTSATVRYLPEWFEDFNAGVSLNIGWQHFFHKEINERNKKFISFGTMNLKAGIPISYRLDDCCSLYFHPAYSLNNINFLTEAGSNNKHVKDMNCLSGIELPIGTVINLGTEGMDLFAEVVPSVYDLREFTKYMRFGANVGVILSL